MITIVLMICSFFFGFAIGAYGLYKRFVRNSENLYLAATADIFSILEKQGYRIIKEGAECNDN
ncbi:hypothetical protein ACFQ38_16220 [Sporosarcina contaminans]|uniref:Uncharacterized protein n=1 Tax=Sporosarcina contaminans TaxID=633403 RepID=A0ABW3U4R4_9BACL